MNHVGRKLYYDILTGNIITDTGERMGSVVATTIEQDIQVYTALSERNPETIGVIELEYGQYGEDFAACTGYRVDPATEKLMFSYPEPANPEAPPVYHPPLSEKVAELQKAQADMVFELMMKGVL